MAENFQLISYGEKLNGMPVKKLRRQESRKAKNLRTLTWDADGTFQSSVLVNGGQST